MTNPIDAAVDNARGRIAAYLEELKTRKGMDQETVSNLRPALNDEPSIELRVDDLELLVEFSGKFSIESLDESMAGYRKSIENQKKSINRLQAIIDVVRRTAADRSVDPVTRIQRIQSKVG